MLTDVQTPFLGTPLVPLKCSQTGTSFTVYNQWVQSPNPAFVLGCTAIGVLLYSKGFPPISRDFLL